MQLIPILPIKGNVILPGTAVPLRVMREQSVAALQLARDSDHMILALTQNNDDVKGLIGAENLNCCAKRWN